jgi:cytochrome P450
MLQSDSREEGAICPHLGHVYNPFESPQLDNPYPFYVQARSEEPVFFSELLQAWVVTRYEDIRSVLLRPDIYSSKDTMRSAAPWAPEVFQILAGDEAISIPTFVNSDGKEHQRFRMPLNQAFLPARIKAMEGTIRTVAHRLIDTFYEERHADLITSFAGPLPQEIILRMFGISQADIPMCKRWSDDTQALVNEPLSLERQIECAHSLLDFHKYMSALIEERRANPGDDVVSYLHTVQYDPVRPLNGPETVITLTGLLIAGHETTTGLIGTALYLLLSQPECWQYICRQPETIPEAVEEALRFDTPVPAFYRTALKEAQIGGVTIPEGALLSLNYASANRDEKRFAYADQFDLKRSPNQHLAFGHGPHFCLGAPLARLEVRIALEALSQRLPRLRLRLPQKLSYTPNLMLRSIKRLTVAWDVSS